MLGVADYPAFVLAFLLLLAIPGPGNLALLLSTGKGGISAGLAATLGIIAGDQILLWLAVAGVAMMLKAHPTVFFLLQWLGAAYLIWLGLRMLLTKPGQAAVLNIRPQQYLRQSLLITLFNPKAIVFYMAFFPLFIDPEQHQGLVTFGFMALTIVILTFTYGLVLVLLCHLLAERMRSKPKLSQLLTRLAGLSLLGFGMKLGLT